MYVYIPIYIMYMYTSDVLFSSTNECHEFYMNILSHLNITNSIGSLDSTNSIRCQNIIYTYTYIKSTSHLSVTNSTSTSALIQISRNQ